MNKNKSMVQIDHSKFNLHFKTKKNKKRRRSRYMLQENTKYGNHHALSLQLSPSL